MDMNSFYLDFAATTPIAPEVASRMIAVLTSQTLFGNASSTTHPYGWSAQQLVESARADVARLLGAKPREFIFTSGATESNNMVLQGVIRLAASRAPSRPLHLITSCIEHKSILDTCKALLAMYPQLQVTYLQPLRDGTIAPSQVAQALRPDTVLVSLMHVNNELGSINPIHEIGEICSQACVFFHVDAAQSVGKLPIALRDLPVDALTFSGHKLYGPKGVGGLYLRHETRHAMAPLVFGGGQERKVRPGTLATHQIEGLAAACSLAQSRMGEHSERIYAARQVFLDQLARHGLRFSINGPQHNGYPGIANLHFPGVDADSLMLKIPHLGMSTGSACNSQQQEGSHVLDALGIPAKTTNLRASFGWDTTTDIAMQAADQLARAIRQVEAEESLHT